MKSPDFESVLTKARKIKALADNGYKGEAIAASEALKRYLLKYDLNLSDLADETRTDRDFKIQGNQIGYRLFSQIVYMVSPDTEKGYYTNKLTKRICKKRAFANLTNAEYIQVCDLLEFHSKLMKKEFKKMQTYIFKAYVNNHKMFPAKPSDSKGPELSLDELTSILSMMSVLDQDIRYIKKLKS